MHAEELAARQEALLARLDALDDRLQAHCSSASKAKDDSNSSTLKVSRTAGTSALSNPIDGSLSVEERLTALLRAGGVSKFEFKRVSAGYYDSPLESRQQELQAASVDHLCKSIVMVRSQIDDIVCLQVSLISLCSRFHNFSMIIYASASFSLSPSLCNLLHNADKHTSSGGNY